MEIKENNKNRGKSYYISMVKLNLLSGFFYDNFSNTANFSISAFIKKLKCGYMKFSSKQNQETKKIQTQKYLFLNFKNL